MGYLTAKDVREYIQDRTIEDNELELDLTFADADIADAMRRAAREYNSTPPFVSRTDAAHLPDDTNVFLDGTALHLYISRYAKLTRSDIDYTAGGVGVNLVAKQIKYLAEGIQFHRDRFNEAVRAIKMAINLAAAYRHFG